MTLQTLLTPDKALIFRIMHVGNLPWLLDNGAHCRSSNSTAPHYVQIGNAELIDKRQNRSVPINPSGTLSDYVPFYFTPASPMLLNIKTGWGGIRQRSNEEILVLVSSLRGLLERGMPFVFTDRHAYLTAASFFSNLSDLNVLDWVALQHKRFKRDPNDPEKFERYQAEALVHRHVPIDALLGIGCYNATVQAHIQSELNSRNLALKVAVRPAWFF